MSLHLSPDTFKMAFGNATIFTPQALPTPTETPRQTPSRNSSYRTRCRRSSSPLSMPQTDSLQNNSKDEATNANQNQDMSPLDPQRFTPNLHASLVGQILTLQREVECRNNTVGNLEEFLHITKAENEKLAQELKEQANENRSINKQMQLLESTTLTALGEIAKERDDATENLAEARHCLQISKTKIRSQEEEAKNTKIVWDKERQNWDVEKRNMETKVHLVEGRLRIVLGEIAATQSNNYRDSGMTAEFGEGSQSIWHHQGSIPTSSRSNSIKSDSRPSAQHNTTNEVGEYLDFRASTLSGLDGFGGSQLIGPSLADELNESGCDEDEEDETANEFSPPNALPGEAQFKPRRPSMQSLSQDQKALKLLGLLPGPVGHAITEDLTEKTATTHGDTEALVQGVPIGLEKVSLPTKETKAQYLDSATQFSPPSSPKLTPQSDLTLAEKVPGKALVRQNNIANKSRKRISAPLTEQTTPPKLVCPLISPTVCAGCQTMERPLSPPLSSMSAIKPPASSSTPSEKISAMTSSCTQTEDAEQAPQASAKSRPKHSSMNIPFIEIHPPGSRPPSSHNSVVLPPRTKSIGCQASIELPVCLRSISVQTDAVVSGGVFTESVTEIVRNVASESLFSESGVEKIDERLRVPRRTAHKIPHRPRSPGSSRPRIKPSHSAPLLDSFPSNNDSGPLSDKMATGLRRPVRNGSLFAGFDSACDKDTHFLRDFDLSSDDDSPAVAPIRKTLSKVQDSWKLVPRTVDKSLGHLKSTKHSAENLGFKEAFDSRRESSVRLEELAHTKSEVVQNRTRFRATAASNSTTQWDIRQAPHKADLSGLQAQRGGPSAEQLAKKIKPVVIPPPFPVPTRSSSRHMPISVSEGAQSPSPYSTTFFSNTRKRGVGRPGSKNPLRKVRSAATVPRFGLINGKERTSHETLSPSAVPFDSSQLPVMSKMDIAPRYPPEVQEVKQTTHALPPDSLSGPASIDTPGQSTSVVDAIAQTMVGEWMWKYVRKRKSFGITDDVDFDEKGHGNGIRHRRWVWLAPYERAVIWSSKQPTSGPALMGKNGRKLTIQSVLDVKDNAPIPKGSNPQACFDRSILILTSQRALKFTATTRDRHYVWLTALSFLSHSPLGLDDLTTIPPIPQEEDQRPSSQHASGGLRRNTIRDSTHVAKLKERPPMGGHAYSSPVPTLQRGRLEGLGMPILVDDPDSDAAEPPAIPRTVAHTRSYARKRSSTGPRPVLPSSYSFPANAAMASTHIPKSPSRRDLSVSPFHGPDASAPGSAHGTIQDNLSQHFHDPMPPLPLDRLRNNFFDAVGTVRMEAFVDKKVSVGVEEEERRRQPPLGNSWAKGHSKKDLSYWGFGGEPKEYAMGEKGIGSRMEDPFQGF